MVITRISVPVRLFLVVSILTWHKKGPVDNFGRSARIAQRIQPRCRKLYIVGGTDGAVSNHVGVDDVVVARICDHNSGLADRFIKGREELGWYTGDIEFLGVGKGGEAVRGCRVAEEA